MWIKLQNTLFRVYISLGTAKGYKSYEQNVFQKKIE